MSPDPFDDAERAQEKLRRQQESITAATAAAQSATTVYEVADGHVRVTVNGRLRIEELYLSERVLRSDELEPLLLEAVNGAMVTMQAEYAERFRAELDPDTAGLLAATEELVEGLRHGPAEDALRRGGPTR